MAITGPADLHTHTNASDGTGDPADNVRLAKAAGLAAVAITDHDTMAGVDEAILEGERIGITVVPGVEVSTVSDGIDIHILGYYADWRNEEWLARLRSLRDVRGIRNEMMVQRLRELGIDITLDEVFAAAGRDGSGEETVGRPHIAQVLLKKGCVATMAEAFDRYLGTSGAAYVNPPRATPFQAVDWIREAGGTSVIAHPGLYGRDQLVEELIAYGVDGIEVYHSDHTPLDEQRYKELAERSGLIITGGSDYHGARGGVVFHGPMGGRSVDASVISRLRHPSGRSS
ncbi:PHP domain-containing protein [Paenibacillus tarimensis]|uniref:PHP domain-containing protein n=1 Tax=Paenibacillus tarimensis TaxID=416012 RepID=UPI001F30023A|nr:PHP domain-containing protein [Paenibacillus tarimensis]MCF2942211.1 PHP domain-containing protein [Paenibacillus tarimensis]